MARYSPALTTALWGLVEEAQQSDPLAPVTVVGPSRYANLHLRHELGLRGFLNVRFIVMPVLSEMLGAASLARAGRQPLTAVMDSVALRTALAGSTGPLGPVREHPSTHASVRASFRQLRRGPDGLQDKLEQQGGVRGEIVRLYRAYRSQVAQSWHDRDDLAEAAADAVLRGETAGLDELGLVVFHLPGGTSPAEAALIEALARRERCAVLLGLTGDDQADRDVKELSATLEGLLGEPRRVGEIGDDAPAIMGEASLHIAPNAHEELRWVIRQILKEASENGTPFHRMAILYGAENPYGTLISDELELAGIPMAGPGRELLADTAVGRALAGMLRLSADREFRRGDVMSWLTGCPVSPPFGRSPGFNPSRWDSLTRKAGVTGGLEQWKHRLNNYANQLTDAAERRLKNEEITEGRAAAMRSDALSARNALAFVELLASDLEPPADGSPWEGFCDWTRRLLDTYLARNLREPEDKALERIRLTLEELGAADSMSPGATLSAFRQTMEESLRSPVGHLGTTGEGVFVSSFNAAAGMTFDALWLVGMIEGQAPPSVPPDPLLPEADWQDAGGRSRPEERMREARYAYLSAISSAPRRALSYPVADASSQREAYPSRWFLEQAGTLEGEGVHTSDLPRLRGRPWLTVVESSEQALAGVDGPLLADRYDYDLHRLLDWTRNGRQPRSHPFAQQGTLASATRLRRERGRRRLTEFDGNLSEAASTAQFAKRLTESPVSATSLESWATCPFRYFLGHVLRIGAQETPEDITTISALDRGLLVHDILEDFVKEAIAAGTLPRPGETWDEGDRERLAQIAEARFKEAESNGVTGKPLLWELAKQDIRDDLETFLEEDSTLRAGNGTSRVLAETDFGIGAESPEVRDPETNLRFRGRIDRIDLNADGTSALVIDYKTGSARSYSPLDKDVIDGGKRLQLGVYSLAARHLVPEAANILAAYWFATTRGGFAFAPKTHFDMGDDDTGSRFRQGIATIAGGIAEGVFPANPGPWTSFGPGLSGPRNCIYCDFHSLCPARRMEAWQRKKSDPLLSGYIELSGGGDEG